MRAEITEKVLNCAICVKHSDNQMKQPMQSVEIPDYPFQIISMDVAKIEYRGVKRNFLITVDHFSDYFEIDDLSDLTPQSTIEMCKKNFCTHGISEMVISDNATNFDNREFREFAKEWEFTHSTSSPYHPKGNGNAEVTVKIAKKLVKKSEEDGVDLKLALLHHRNTPNKTDYSPVQRIFVRRNRCQIPTKLENLKPKIATDVESRIEANKLKSKTYHDQNSRKLPSLEIGKPVVFKLHPEIQKDWNSGTLQRELDDRSLIIEANGNEYRRNREHVKPSPLKPVRITEPASDVYMKPFQIQTDQPEKNSDPSQTAAIVNNKSPTTPIQIKREKGENCNKSAPIPDTSITSGNIPRP